MLKILALVVVLLSFTITASAYAHTSEIVYGFKVEIGWVNEPPIQGVDNAVELFVTEATEFEKQLEEEKKAKEAPTPVIENVTKTESPEKPVEEDGGHDHSSHDHGSEPIPEPETKLEPTVAELPELEHHLNGTEGQIQQIILDKENRKISLYKAVHTIEDLLNRPDFKHNDVTEKIHNIVSKVFEENDITHSSAFASVKNIIDDEVEKTIQKKTESETIIEEPVPVTGLANKIEIRLDLGETKSFLKLVEDETLPGRYEAKITPLDVGLPLFNIFLGTVGEEEISIVLHPESVEPAKPKLIFDSGYDVEQIKCAKNKVLMMKASGDGIACINSGSAEKLENRGWTRVSN